MALVKIPKCPHAKPRLSPDDFGEQLVFVVVGKDDKARRFTVFKNLLTYHSSYFRAALEGNWIEGIENKVNLPEDDPDVFKAFHNWLYTGELYSQPTIDGKIPLNMVFIAQMYVFGDARGVPDLCNASVNLFAQSILSEFEVEGEVIPYMYENTPAHCGLRRLIVKFTVEKLVWKRDQMIYLPKEYLVDVIIQGYTDYVEAVRARFIPKNYYIEEFASKLCNFHDHH